MSEMTNKELIASYRVRYEMVSGYIAKGKYTTHTTAGRNTTPTEDYKELADIDFKLHVLGQLEDIKNMLMGKLGVFENPDSAIIIQGNK